MILGPVSTAQRPRVAVALGLVVTSVGYLVERIVAFADQSSIDFRHTWVAGQMWVDGANPYSAEFARVGAESFTSGDLPRIWVYPPNWFVLATPFDLFGDVTGSVIWNVGNSILLLLACWILAGIVRDQLPAFPEWSRRLFQSDRPDVDRLVLFAVHLAFVTFLQGTAIALTTGQTGVMAFFAMVLLVWAMINNRETWGVFAIVLLMLKPQVGIIVCVALLFDRTNWVMVGKAAAATILSAAPAFIRTSPNELLSEMLDNWDALYSPDYGPTNPERVSGLRNLAEWVGMGDVGVQVGVVFALLALIGFYVWPRGRGGAGNLRFGEPLGTMIASIGAIVGFVTLQTYDLPMIGLLFVAALASRGTRLVLILSGFALVYRSQNVELKITHDALTSGRLEAIAGLLLLAAVAGLVASGKPLVRAES